MTEVGKRLGLGFFGVVFLGVFLGVLVVFLGVLVVFLGVLVVVRRGFGVKHKDGGPLVMVV